MKEIKGKNISQIYIEEKLIKNNYISNNIFAKENNYKSDSNISPEDNKLLGKNKKYKLRLVENKNDYTKIFKLIIISYFLIKIISRIEYNIFVLNISKIRLKIKGIGKHLIYNENKPDEIYINGNKQYVIQNQYSFDLLDNLIELVD